MMNDPLSRRERQILDVLYARGSATAADVLSALPDPPSYSAVRALLRILEAKGHARHEQQGTRYVYLPVVPRDSARNRRSRASSRPSSMDRRHRPRQRCWIPRRCRTKSSRTCRHSSSAPDERDADGFSISCCERRPCCSHLSVLTSSAASSDGSDTAPDLACRGYRCMLAPAAVLSRLVSRSRFPSGRYVACVPRSQEAQRTRRAALDGMRLVEGAAECAPSPHFRSLST